MELRRSQRVQRSLSPSHTSLMRACQQELTEDVKTIIERQPATALQRDRTGKNALHYCAENSGVDCASRVLSAAPVLLNTPDDEGYTALHLAVISGNRCMVKYLLTKGADSRAVDSEKHSCVHWATVSGDPVCLELLIKAGADPSTPDIHGAYPVHYAAQMCGPNSEMGNDVQAGLSVLRKLLEYRVDVSVVDRDGRPPLLWAASGGSSDAILALVKAGANVNATDRDGLTALHCAASRGHVDCLETLVTYCGADVDKADDNGCTALFYAVTLGHADCTNFLLNFGANPNRQDNKGRTAAHCGAAKGQLETLKILAQHRANLWLRNAKGDMPLHEAVQSGRKDLVEWFLQRHQGAVNVTNANGRTPLHIAAITNNVDMCKVLMDYGAYINPVMRNTKGQHMTPLDAALHRGNRNCAKYLNLHGAYPASKLQDRRDYKRAPQTHLSDPLELSPNTRRMLVRDSSAQTEPQRRDVDTQARVDQRNAAASTDRESTKVRSTANVRCPAEDGSGKPIIAKVYVHTKRSKTRRLTKKPTVHRRDVQTDKLYSYHQQRPNGRFRTTESGASTMAADSDTPRQTDQEKDVPSRKASQPMLYEDPAEILHEEEELRSSLQTGALQDGEPDVDILNINQDESLNLSTDDILNGSQDEILIITQEETTTNGQEGIEDESSKQDQTEPLAEDQEGEAPNANEDESFDAKEEETLNADEEAAPQDEALQEETLNDPELTANDDEKETLDEDQEEEPDINGEETLDIDHEEKPNDEDEPKVDQAEDSNAQQNEITNGQEDDQEDIPVAEYTCYCYTLHAHGEDTCACKCHATNMDKSHLLSVQEIRRSSIKTHYEVETQRRSSVRTPYEIEYQRSTLRTPYEVETRTQSSLRTTYDNENLSPLSSIRSFESTTIKDSGFSDDIERYHREEMSSSGDDQSDSAIHRDKRTRKYITRYLVSSSAAEKYHFEEEEDDGARIILVPKPRSSSLPHMKKTDRHETCHRLLNRPTLNKDVRRSLKRYQMERRLFYELQELKRKQITAAPGEEKEIVMKMVERFRNHVLSPVMTDFHGPFTFRTFEKYLYEQLRKLSMGGKIPKPKGSTKDTPERLYMAPISKKNTRVAHALCTCETHKCCHPAQYNEDDLETEKSRVPLLPQIIPKSKLYKDQLSRIPVNRSKSWDRLDDSPRKNSTFVTCADKLDGVPTSKSLPSLSNPFPRRVPAALLAAINERLGSDIHPEDTIVVEMSSDDVGPKMRHAFTVQEIREIVSKFEEQAGRKVKPIPLETVLDPEEDEEGPITFEIRHGKEKNVFRLPAGKLKDNKKWQVTFTIGKWQKDVRSLHAK